MSKASEKQAEQAAALEELKATLKEGDRLYTILRSVSGNGMSRVISVVKADASGEISRLDWLISKAGIYTRTPFGAKVDGLKVRGVGMDMGWDTVYTISRYVGFELKQEWL